jgi:hypothetical protein
MMDRIEGFLEVGIAGDEIVVNHPDLQPDENGVGHIRFSPNQARNLAYLLIRKADEVEKESRLKFWQEQEAKVPPVDRTARVLTDGSPETPDYREIDHSTGQQKGYIVLSAEERSKGFVRPVRRTYTHITCNSDTTMGVAIAETYARDPKFYSGTFCCHCGMHYPLDQFVWKGTDELVGQ